MINEDTESFCSYKSWTTYTEQESDLRSNSFWCDVDADEKDEDPNVIKLLGDECLTYYDPDQQQCRIVSSWVCTDYQGNQSEVVGLGTAWSCTDIFKDNSKHLPKNAQEASSFWKITCTTIWPRPVQEKT